MQLKLKSNEIDSLGTVIHDNNDNISRLETENRAIETDLEKCQNKLANNKMTSEVVQKEMQRVSDSQTTVLQMRINELEQSNIDLIHQVTELQCLIKKEKHDHILLLGQATRESQTSLIKYRNDNTKLVVQVSNNEDIIRNKEQIYRAEILRLEDEIQRCHQDAIRWKNEAELLVSLLSSARASEESLKTSLIEAENKLMLIEGIKRELEIKVHEDQHELTVMNDKNKLLDERLGEITHQFSSLREQMKGLKESYEGERFQMKSSMDDDRVRMQEDFQKRVSHDTCMNV